MPLTLLDFIISASHSLLKFDTRFSLLKVDDLDVFSLEVRSIELNKLFTKTQEMFEKCLEYLQSSEYPNKDDIDSVDRKNELIVLSQLKSNSI